MIKKPLSQAYAKRIIGYGSAAALLYAFSPSLLAQEVANTTQADGPVVEEVLVTGVRRSLENALDVKRNSSSIVDAISAEDIDSLPALDLGEALQAIPGIQLNRDAEGRTSEISLRGLPGNFVKTTAFGQSFANPTRSASPAGASNPFSAFEAGVFDGVTVVKAPTAEYQAGGISGIVDKKLQQALSKPDGRFSINLGTRYEDLTESFDRNISMQGSKHLIEDRLAVAFKFAASDQNFRRDTLNTIDYVPLDDTTLEDKLDSDNPDEVIDAQTAIGRHFPNVDAYRAAWNIPENAQIRAVGGIRNVTELGSGDRMSLTGNIEFQVNDQLKIGSHLLFTRRDLDNGTKEDTFFNAGFNLRRQGRNSFSAQLIPDITSEPFIYQTGVDKDGNEFDVYGVSKVNIRNGSYIPNNRKTTFLEESKGLFLYAEYETDAWTIDTKATYSEADNQFSNVGLDFRHAQDFRPTSNNKGTQPTNINGFINSGEGDLSQIEAVFTGWDTYNYDGITWSVPSRSAGSTTAGLNSDGDKSNGGRRLQFFVDGRVDNPNREFSSIEANFLRELEIDFDVFSLDSVKFGGRVSKEDLTNRDQKVGAPGINVDNIGSGFLNDNLVSTQGDEFFGGAIPGTFGIGSGWQTFDNDAVANALQDGLLDLTVADGDGNPPGPALTIASPTGFYDRLNNVTTNPNPNFFANNFTTDQVISAAYIMGNFSGDLGAVSYSGNVGLRYEQTKNNFIGVERVFDNQARPRTNSLVDRPSENEYDNLLPSLNLTVNLTDDVLVRTAYYQALVRPNIRSTNPSLIIQENNRSFNITPPSSELLPYSSDNFDISLEWYNRSGSALSLGFFQKEITDLFSPRERGCPDLDTLSDDVFEDVVATTGPILRESSAGSSETTCVTENEFETDNPDEPPVTKSVEFQTVGNIDAKVEVRGFEFAAQQNLDFLPAPWSGFGGVFNYTKINQETDAEDQRAALLRASPESFNLITYWENKTVSVRFSYNWRDDSIIRGNNSFLGLDDRVQKAQGRLDFSGSYKFSRKLRLSLRAFNLTNERRKEFYGFNEKAIARHTHDGRIYQVGLNYTF